MCVITHSTALAAPNPVIRNAFVQFVTAGGVGLPPGPLTEIRHANGMGQPQFIEAAPALRICNNTFRFSFSAGVKSWDWLPFLPELRENLGFEPKTTVRIFVDEGLKRPQFAANARNR
jgi:hypothetical protein